MLLITVHAYNSSPQGDETGGRHTQDWLKLQRNCQAIQGYLVRSCLKTNQTKAKQQQENKQKISNNNQSKFINY